MTRVVLMVMACLSIGSARPCVADTVERRGGEPAVEGQIVRADIASLEIRDVHDTVIRLSWDRVRDVRTDHADPGLQRQLRMAEDLWRARTRLERHDAVLAEPLFEQWFPVLQGTSGETTLVVAEGLLRCRLQRGAIEAAVIPALEVARLRRAGVSTDSYSLMSPVIDESTALCPQAAPAWIDRRAVLSLLRDLEGYEAGGDAHVVELARWYRLSAAWAIGERTLAELPGRRAGDGVEFLADIVMTQSPERADRQAARKRLERQIERSSPWQRAWARFAIGSSLVRETGDGRGKRGLVQLVHVPVQYGRNQRFLSGVALERIAGAMEAVGKNRQATTLRLELVRRYPNHLVSRLPAEAMLEVPPFDNETPDSPAPEDAP